MALPYAENWTGTNGDPWSGDWATGVSSGATVDIQSNAGRMLGGTLGGYADYCRALLDDQGASDFDLTVDLELTMQSEHYPVVSFRTDRTWSGSAAAYPANGYAVQVKNDLTAGNGTWAIEREISGSRNTVSSGSFTNTAGDVVHLNVVCEGTSVEFRIWRNAESKPAAATYSFTDSTYQSQTGHGLSMEGGGGISSDIRWDNLSIEPLAEHGTFVQTLGTAASSTSGSTLSVTYTGATKPQVGDLVVVYAARDNAASEPDTNSTDSISAAPGSGVWHKTTGRSPSTTAGTGVVGAFFYSILTEAWPSEDNTITWSFPSVTAKVMRVEHYHSVAQPRELPVRSANGTTGALSVVSPDPVEGDLVLAFSAYEHESSSTITADSDTTNGSWSAQTPQLASGASGGAAHVKLATQRKVVDATGTQTYDTSNSSTIGVDAVGMVAVFTPTPPTPDPGDLVQVIGVAQSLTASTSISLTFDGATKPQVGDLVVVYGARDNTGSDTIATDDISVSPGGNTFTRAAAVSGASAGTGIVGALFYSILTDAWPSGTNTLTWSFTPSVAAKVMRVEHYHSVSGVRGTPDTATGTAGALSVESTDPVEGDLVLAVSNYEHDRSSTITADSDTTNGAWSTQTPDLASGGISAFAHVKLATQRKVVDATGTQTYNTSNSTTTLVDAVGIVAVFEPGGGAATVTGTVTGAFAFTGPATATATTAGTASGAFTFTAPAAGEVTHPATATGTFTFTGPASATATTTGTASGSFTFAAPAAGTVTGVTAGTATGAFDFAGPATATATTPGTATGVFTFTGPASATTIVEAAAPGAFVFAAPAAGSRETTGTATGVFAYTAPAAGVGTSPGAGTATGTFTFTAAAAATRTTHAVAATSLTFAGPAAGTSTGAGTATGSFTFTGPAGATVTVTAAASTSLTFAAPAVGDGVVVVSGQAATHLTFVAPVAATTSVDGTAATDVEFAAIVAAVVTRHGTAVGDFDFAAPVVVAADVLAEHTSHRRPDTTTSHRRPDTTTAARRKATTS